MSAPRRHRRRPRAPWWGTGRKAHAQLDVVHFDIVGGCQLRCVGCPNSTILNKVTRQAPSDFAACLSNIDVGHVALFRLFNYGEPLLHDDLPGVFDALESAPPFSIGFLEMSTNAQFVRWDQLEDVLRRRVLSRLVVSCDGDGTPAGYERLRPPAKWDKLMAFLATARELRDRHCPGMELMTRTIVFEEQGMRNWRRVLEPLGWTPEFRGWITLVDASENLSGRQPQVGKGLCPFVQSPRTLYVDWNGTVVPCCAHPRAADLGNLTHTKWSSIVAAERRREFLERLEHDRSSLPICRTCAFGQGAFQEGALPFAVSDAV